MPPCYRRGGAAQLLPKQGGTSEKQAAKVLSDKAFRLELDRIVRSPLCTRRKIVMIVGPGT
jgi:hypothetical protein